MKRKIVRRELLFFAAVLVLLWLLWPERFPVNVPIALSGWNKPTAEELGQRLRVPEGFSLALYATNLPGARMLRFTVTGDLLVSLPGKGKIVLLERDADGDGQADGRRDLLTGLTRPHGIDFHGDWLYVAESHAVGRVRFDAKARQAAGPFERILRLPAGGMHWSRTLRMGQDGWMYVSIGSSCNACEEENPWRAALVRFRPDGAQAEIYATGLRNTVGFDWRPGTNVLYATDNGRDFLGDDLPPCELNRIEAGKSFGWPYAYGDHVPDPDFGEGHENKVRESVAPVHHLSAHAAPLGIAFVRGSALPRDYQGAALVALHGSWNRTEKAGYEVVSLHFDEKGGISERKLVTGFELEGDVIGRPVDIAEGPDGAIYISDDFSGSIYRLSHQSEASDKN